MSVNSEPRSETYLRLSARSTILALILSLALAATFITMMVAPGGALASALQRAPWFFPMFTIFLVVGQQSWFRSQKWDPNAPEAKALMNDAWRQMAADRAARITLFVVLVTQPVIAGVAMLLPMPSALFVMAAVTMELGVATFLLLFYFRFYGGESADGR